ncbi:DNA mismatch repair protein MutT [Planktotalea sp.]|uniref:NUDIX hydrolase n=1 Tax=Planktotalea sp. TaxID=2029877 RepID=UPI0035C825B4
MNQPAPIDKTAIRHAATVIVLRDRQTEPRVLMGQRGAKAAFMPNKFVFPGGAVDAGDADVPLAGTINDSCLANLLEQTDADRTHALGVAAIRELWEETGLILGSKGTWQTDPAEDWITFAETGHVPNASALQFVFRAVTPPGRPRRFDARFFMIDADALTGDIDDFSEASDELSHLQWIALKDVRQFDLPFITEVVLAEISGRSADAAPPESVPMFLNNEEESLFLRLRGYTQGD